MVVVRGRESWGVKCMMTESVSRPMAGRIAAVLLPFVSSRSHPHTQPLSRRPQPPQDGHGCQPPPETKQKYPHLFSASSAPRAALMSDPVDPADQQAILEYQGKRHALPVKHGCIRAADLKPAAGLMSYDPGTSCCGWVLVCELFGWSACGWDRRSRAGRG